MANYLEQYAKAFKLPVRSGLRVERLSRLGSRFVVVAGNERFEADNVVVAMANYQQPRTPAFARELSRNVVQLHSSEYRNPSQLQDGAVLVVGSGNSGAEIALELVKTHRTFLAGKPSGYIPFRIEGTAARLLLEPLVLRVVFHRLLTIKTPIGRKVRPKMLHSAAPLIRTKPRDLVAAGVERIGRVAGVADGLPVLENGDRLEVANVVWCTGYRPGFSWIDLPIFDLDGHPRHDAGVVGDQPGLYFVGLNFLYAFSSEMIHGVGRDAARIAEHVASRMPAPAVAV
jgi:putative flavoprotein involved in K+ transport